MNDQPTCPICGNTAEHLTSQKKVDNLEVTCSDCGHYVIDRLFALSLVKQSNGYARHILSGITRAASDHDQPIYLDANNVDQLIEEAPVPRTLFEAMDRMLLYLAKRAANFVHAFDPGLDHAAPVVFAKDKYEVDFLVLRMKETGLVKWESSNNILLTVNGWGRVEELKATGVQSDQAFVAMWFHPSTEDAWENGFKPALIDTGYQPVRVDLIEHNQKICDRIIAEIRQSGMVVADFTGNRGGVYYETGYAQGLGIPLIWSCHEDHIQDVHFDTRQYNHVVWKTPEDLRSQLIDRVRATIPSTA